MVWTLLAEWAYAAAYADTANRMARPRPVLDFHNHSRPHWSLAGQPPISRAPVNNPRGQNT